MVAGLSIFTTVLAPTAANAAVGDTQTLFYTQSQNNPVPPPNSSNYWVQAVLTELAGGIKFDFTTNFSSPTNFANDFVFSFNKALNISSVTCASGTGTTCIASSGSALYDYDSAGLNKFINTSGWELQLNTPPPPGGVGDVLNGAGNTMSFTVLATVLSGTRALNLTDFNKNDQGYSSCTHGQGLDVATGLVSSSRLCTGDGTPPPGDTSVPGPLPLLGAGAAFGYSRRIRTRIQSSRQQATIS